MHAGGMLKNCEKCLEMLVNMFKTSCKDFSYAGHLNIHANAYLSAASRSDNYFSYFAF